MESNAQKIIKLIVIGAAWAIWVVVPPYITIEPPLQLAIRAIFVVLPVLIYGRKSASLLLKIVWDFGDKCIKVILESIRFMFITVYRVILYKFWFVLGEILGVYSYGYIINSFVNE